MEGSNEIPNDVENQKHPLGTLMREELIKLSAVSPMRCIYRVPDRLRKGNEEVYTPQVVSIGPVHHGKEHLAAMEEHKMRYLKDFLLRTELSLEDYIQIVRDQEVKLRNCYAEKIKFSSDEFVRLVLVDAVFIIELLMRNNLAEFRDEDDYIFHKPWMENDVSPDLGMLENQLPFFILDELSASSYKIPSSALFISYISFGSQVCNVGRPEEEQVALEKMKTLTNIGVEVKHFLDVIRHLLEPVELNTRGKFKYVPSITELHQAGVKFKVRSTATLLDIRFADGILEIPKLQIHDDTQTEFRNLVAFEQCHYIGKPYISEYVSLMDCFVNTPKDVELLVKYGIVENLLGDNSEVSAMINSLGNGVITDYDDFYYAAISEGLDTYCRTRWHKWKANLRQNYLNTPWTIVSVFAAILLLALTFIQAASSVKSFI